MTDAPPPPVDATVTVARLDVRIVRTDRAADFTGRFLVETAVSGPTLRLLADPDVDVLVTDAVYVSNADDSDETQYDVTAITRFEATTDDAQAYVYVDLATH